MQKAVILPQEVFHCCPSLLTCTDPSDACKGLLHILHLPALTQVLLHDKDTQSLLAPVATVPAALPVSLGSGMHPLLLRDEARAGVPGRPWLIS